MHYTVFYYEVSDIWKTRIDYFADKFSSLKIRQLILIMGEKNTIKLYSLKSRNQAASTTLYI